MARAKQYDSFMLHERIRNLRLSKNLTLQQVAEEFGTTKASVSNWENGKSNPDSKKIMALAAIFGVSVQYLLTGDASTESNLNFENDNEFVAFVEWKDIYKFKPKSNSPRVKSLHSKLGKRSFATRYSGTTDFAWSPSAIPAGSVLILDPDLKIQVSDFVLFKTTGSMVHLGQVKNTPENKLFIKGADHPSEKNYQISECQVLAVVLEWQISSKTR